MIKVLVADGIDQEGLSPITSNHTFQLIYVTELDQIRKEIADADALLVRSKTKVVPELIALGKKLRFIGRAGVGVDNIDVPAASKKGIIVANVPGGNTISAAEHTFALMLGISRNLPQSHVSTLSGQWKREQFVGTELKDKRLGLIGFGRIGKEVAKRALPFEMKVLVYDPFVSEAHIKSFGAHAASLEEVLRTSDYISLHIPVTDQTMGMINDEAFAKMKPDAYLINCARGELVDEAALIRALQSKKIKGAALDVFSSEPPKNQELFKFENLIVTPHLGASTQEAQIKVAQELAKAMRDFFQKGVVRNAVNLPALEPELLEQMTPYLDLTEKLGRFVSQIVSGGIQEIKIEFAGDFSSAMRDTLSLSVVKGILITAIEDKNINLISAIPIAKERGIRIEVTSISESENFSASLITVRLKTDKTEKSVSGSCIIKDKGRIVFIDDLSVDVIPEGHLLVFTNVDRPGVVGFIGTLLGENQINIAQFQVGRKKMGGEAVSVLNVDSPIPPQVLEKIKKFSGITNVWLVDLK